MMGLTYKPLHRPSTSSHVQERGADGTGGSENGDVNYCACHLCIGVGDDRLRYSVAAVVPVGIGAAAG
jgi:hypothetical protein